jgi:tripartite-type tricarboxylate transporter receptor subunit TctC
MKPINRRTVLRHSGSAALIAASGLGSPGLLRAQGAEWPNRPVRVVVNFQPGGGSDAAARPFMDRLSRTIGQQFVIENKGGASGAVGAEAIVKSTPDGYNFLATPSLTLMILPHLRKLAFDPLKDLIPVSCFVEGQLLVATHPSVPANTIQELAAYAKANPGKLAWGTPGVGSYGHLICEAFKHATGTDILHVPYRGTGEVMSDFLANIVQIQADPITLAHVPSGKAKLLAVLGRQRRPDYPNVPMLKEVYPEMDFVVWIGVFAPVGTPAEIVARMSDALRKAADDEDLRKNLFPLALSPAKTTPEETKALLNADFERYGKLIKQFNIKVD